MAGEEANARPARPRGGRVYPAGKARGRRDAVTSFLAFDVLVVGGREVMAEPWEDRRKRLEDIGAVLDSNRIAVVPISEDANRLWSLWVGSKVARESS
jgi:ATP-dependent DNA ligase